MRHILLIGRHSLLSVRARISSAWARKSRSDPWYPTSGFGPARVKTPALASGVENYSPRCPAEASRRRKMLRCIVRRRAERFQSSAWQPCGEKYSTDLTSGRVFTRAGPGAELSGRARSLHPRRTSHARRREAHGSSPPQHQLKGAVHRATSIAFGRTASPRARGLIRRCARGDLSARNRRLDGSVERMPKGRRSGRRRPRRTWMSRPPSIVWERYRRHRW